MKDRVYCVQKPSKLVARIMREYGDGVGDLPPVNEWTVETSLTFKYVDGKMIPCEVLLRNNRYKMFKQPLTEAVFAILVERSEMLDMLREAKRFTLRIGQPILI